MKNRGRAAVNFAFCSLNCGRPCYANGLRAVPINTCIKDLPHFSFEVAYEF